MTMLQKLIAIVGCCALVVAVWLPGYRHGKPSEADFEKRRTEELLRLMRADSETRLDRSYQPTDADIKRWDNLASLNARAQLEAEAKLPPPPVSAVPLLIIYALTSTVIVLVAPTRR